MDSIAYVWYVFGKGLRVIEAYVNAMFGREGSRAHANRHVPRPYTEGNHTKTTDAKTHVLVANSTGITGKDKWVEIKCNV